MDHAQTSAFLPVISSEDDVASLLPTDFLDVHHVAAPSTQQQNIAAFSLSANTGAGTVTITATNAAATFRKATVDLLRSYQNANPDFRFPDSVPRRCLTKPSQPVHNNRYDNRAHDYILFVNDVLSDDHGNQYVVLDLLGTGTFGQVVKCRHSATNEIVAVKVIKNQRAYYNQAWVEISILRILHQNSNQEDTKHIVRFICHFMFRGHLCLVFEKLSINLYEVLKLNSYVGVSLEMLRNFLTQLLQALDVLVRSEVIHCDLKPENILLKSLDSTDLKIIDFGSACQLEHPVYSYVQSRFYRSPEVLLGLAQYDSKIDMWSLGCVAGELFLGIPLFPGQNEMNMVSRIVEMLGAMPDMFLRRCRHTQRFFNINRTSDGTNDVRMYELKPTEQFEREFNLQLPEWRRYFSQRRLEDIIMSYPFRTPEPHTEEIALRRSFVDLLNGMLKVDPLERFSPAEALAHPFIRLGPLPDGQPWQPPTRPRRMQISRPVPIENPHDGAGDDGLYSSSAPSLARRNRFSHNPHMGSDHGMAGQFGDPSAIPGGHASRHYGNYLSGNSPNIPMATGSYVPASTFSLYGYGGASGGYTGPSSYDPRSFVFPGNAESAATTVGGRSINTSHGQLVANVSGLPTGPLQTSNMTDGNSPGLPSLGPGVPITSLSVPLPAGGARRGGPLHVSSSRESLSASLGMSASRESLGLARVASPGDLGEDAVFPFSDDEGFAPGSNQHYPTGQSPGVMVNLPPTQPTSISGRQGSATYNQTSALANSCYSYAQQGRGHQAGGGASHMNQMGAIVPAPFMTDVDMTAGGPDATMSPGNSGSGGNAYKRRPPQPQAPYDGIQSPRSRNSASSRGPPR